MRQNAGTAENGKFPFGFPTPTGCPEKLRVPTSRRLTWPHWFMGPVFVSCSTGKRAQKGSPNMVFVLFHAEHPDTLKKQQNTSVLSGVGLALAGSASNTAKTATILAHKVAVCFQN